MCGSVKAAECGGTGETIPYSIRKNLTSFAQSASRLLNTLSSMAMAIKAEIKSDARSGVVSRNKARTATVGEEVGEMVKGA
jgi:hypothetical protein